MKKRIYIVDSLKKYLMKLSFDLYGAHEIEKLLINLNYENHLQN